MRMRADHKQRHRQIKTLARFAPTAAGKLDVFHLHSTEELADRLIKNELALQLPSEF